MSEYIEPSQLELFLHGDCPRCEEETFHYYKKSVRLRDGKYESIYKCGCKATSTRQEIVIHNDIFAHYDEPKETRRD